MTIKNDFISPVGGRFDKTVVSAAFTAREGQLVAVRTSLGAIAVAIPDPAAQTGIAVMVGDEDSSGATNPIVVTPAAGTIDGAATFTLDRNDQIEMFVSDGVKWVRTTAQRQIYDVRGRALAFVALAATLAVAVSNFGSATVSTTGQVSAGNIAVGATPRASAGDIRMSKTATIKIRNNPDNFDISMLAYDGADNVLIGSNTNLQGDIYLQAGSAQGVRAIVGGQYAWRASYSSGPQIELGGPIVGDTGQPSAFSVHGLVAVAMADANQTLSTAQYKFTTIKTTGAITANRNVTLPAAASDAQAYHKVIDNTCTGAGFAVVATTGAGTSVVVPNGQRLSVLVDSRGVTQNTIASDPTVDGLRLTLTTAVPITTSDVATSTSVFLTPYLSGQIALYDGVNWIQKTTPEVSLAIGTLTSGRNYDVFAFISGNAVALELSAAWNADNVTRTDALARQDGVLSKSGTLTRRYVGTFRTISTTQTTDSLLQRYLWNMYGRVPRKLYAKDTTDSWTYVNPNSVWRQANSATANAFEYVAGDTTLLSAHVQGQGLGSAALTCVVGIGLDSTTVNSADLYGGGVDTVTGRHLNASYKGWPAVGYHKIQWLETGTSAAATCTFYGDAGLTVIQTGILGEILGAADNDNDQELAARAA